MNTSRLIIHIFFLEPSGNRNSSSTLPTSLSTVIPTDDSQGEGNSESSWPFRSQSTDRSLIRRSMHLYLESAHNANQGKLVLHRINSLIDSKLDA